MPRRSTRNAVIFLVIQEIMLQHLMQLIVVVDLLLRLIRKKRKCGQSYSMIERIQTQYEHLHRIMASSDTDAIVNLRIDRNCFQKLCKLLRELGGLRDGKFVTVEEQVAMFLGILAHHKKNSIVRFDYWRSGQTVSHYVHLVLKSILSLHNIFLVKPKAVLADENDPRWKCFKGCLGALDGTYINVKVPIEDKPRYRTRKGQISTNTLAVCDRQLRFVYVLSGWEGSAADCRVLRDAINRPNGLRVPKGCYYLCDNEYANSEGFLTPYKGVRYHLKEWGRQASRPSNKEEMFNMRHSKARNVIERAFGVMKMRWGILRSSSYYPIKTQNRLIMACFLLHNFIRSHMSVDPFELQFDATDNTQEDEDDMQFIDSIESSAEWNEKRNEIALEMWLGGGGIN